MVRSRTEIPARSCTEVGPGDYIWADGAWKKIAKNTAYGHKHTPTQWYVTTEDDREYNAWSIFRYATAGDINEE